MTGCTSYLMAIHSWYFLSSVWMLGKIEVFIDKKYISGKYMPDLFKLLLLYGD